MIIGLTQAIYLHHSILKPDYVYHHKGEDNTAHSALHLSFFIVSISVAVLSLLAIPSKLEHCVLLYMLLFDGEGRLLTYLTCTSAWGKLTVFQAPLQGASSGVLSRACMVFMNNMSVYLISYHAALASHSASPHCPLSHPQKKPLYPSFSRPAEVTSCIHYQRFSDRLSNYHVRVTQCKLIALYVLYQREWVGVCPAGFRG